MMLNGSPCFTSSFAAPLSDPWGEKQIRTRGLEIATDISSTDTLWLFNIAMENHNFY